MFAVRASYRTACCPCRTDA